MPTRELAAAEIRRRLLAEKRMFIDDSGSGGVTYKAPNRTGDMTTMQRHIEARFGQPLEELLWESSAFVVAEKLDIGRMTVLKWRKKFKVAA